MMNHRSFRKARSRTLSVVCILFLLLFPAGALLVAQDPAPPPPAPSLSPEQLDTLVAPIALYPDSLLSQVLVAATYPLELVEAGQWLQQNRNLQGLALVNAAQQQNWDPSVQALVVFPDVLNLLTSNVRWTTDLGNAFLAQQADVMQAVQRMRAQAQAAGRLSSNSQQTVTTQTQDDQPVIEIAPANPQVVYVPAYDPAYIWGPPVWGYYPPLYYPEFGFGPGIYIGGFFGGLGWGGWGWGPNWFNCTIIENRFFFNHYGFGGFRGGFNGGVWAHNPGHRLGVPYPNPGVASRFGGGTRWAGSPSGFGNPRGRFSGTGNRGSVPAGNPGGGWRRFGEPGPPAGRGVQSNLRGNTQNRYAAPPLSRGGGSWSRFGSPGSQPAFRSSPPPGSAGARAYSPSFGGSRAAPAYRPSPAFNGGAFRSAPSFGGGGGYRSAPSFGGGGGGYRSAPSFSGGGGGGFRGGGGGGGSRGGGGGGSHGGGGGHRR